MCLLMVIVVGCCRHGLLSLSDSLVIIFKKKAKNVLLLYFYSFCPDGHRRSLRVKKPLTRVYILCHHQTLRLMGLKIF